MSIPWIHEYEGPESLPAPQDALREPNGLLAAGGSLSPSWLLSAYRAGVFPWYDEDQPILWWSPDPRAVLWPDAMHVSRSLRKAIRQRRFTVTADTAFADVISACAAPREYASGTWITRRMAAAYTTLHEQGWAHSFEVWVDRELTGGIYGVCIGDVFFGESMFSRRSNASKFALASAVALFKRIGIEMIDCQIPSAHLARLGAEEIPRQEFLDHLQRLCKARRAPGVWTDQFAQLETDTEAD